MTQAHRRNLPRWELANIYLGLEADDYKGAIAELGSILDETQALFDAEGIRRDANLTPDDAQLAESLEQALALANRWGRLSGTLSSFVYAYVSTDSYNALAARELSKLEMLGTRWQKLHVRLQGWIGSLARAVAAAACGPAEPRRARRFILRRHGPSQPVSDERRARRTWPPTWCSTPARPLASCKATSPASSR